MLMNNLHIKLYKMGIRLSNKFKGDFNGERRLNNNKSSPERGFHVCI